MKYVILAPDSPTSGFFVYIPDTMIDVVSGITAYLSERRFYASDGDYERGYNAIALIKACMLDCPAQRLLNGVDNVIRHLDAIHNGTEYTVISSEPLVISPDIPIVPSTVSVLPGEKARLEEVTVKLQTIIDNMDANDENIGAILEAVQALGVLLA
jgi:hypothetical protein